MAKLLVDKLYFMNNKLTYKTPIRIVHDWKKPIMVLEMAIKMVESNSDRITKQYKYSDAGYHYEIGNTGTVSHVTNGSNYWYAFSGPLLESTMMPWLPRLINDIHDLEPTFVTMNKMVGSGAEHRDQLGQNVGLNYFITTTDSTTFVRDGDYAESYPSIENTGWILNIQKPHRIENPSTRIWFNLRFGKPFEYCKEWFENNQMLIYE